MQRVKDILTYITSLFSIREATPELVHSQIPAFRKLIPLMYLIVCTNTGVLSMTYYGHAPDTLALYIPLALIIICFTRFIIWYRIRHQELTYQAAARALRLTNIFAFILGAGFTSWTSMLIPYGSEMMKQHTVFLVAITALSCLLCLMHMRSAVLTLSCTILIPFTGMLLYSGDRTYISIALNVILVGIAVVIILAINFNNFADLIKSKRELQDMHDRLETLADTDSLTKLANRRQFFTNLDDMLERSLIQQRRLSIALLDLDGFKPVNDAYGHDVGDMVLVEVSRRLQTIRSDAICVARLGGDEFGIILNGEYSDQELRIIGLEICLQLRKPYLIDDIPAKISASIGFASCPQAANTSEKLYKSADYALYHAKRHERSSPVLFSCGHKKEIEQNSLIDQKLRDDRLHEYIDLAYQPIVDISHDKPMSFEALARWDDADMGIIPPSLFIKVAERNGHIGKLTELLLEKALHEAKNWPEDVFLSFNLSAYDVATHGAADRLIEIVEKSAVPSNRIDFEVTETAIMLDFEKAHRTLKTLKEHGMRISLDDFGSGYSSLNYVHQLPIDRIKIDRGFISNIEQGSVSADVVRTIVDMCSTLSLDCIVEGVETWQQFNLMRDMGCRWMQGYFFGKPMPAENIRVFTRNTAHPKLLKTTDNGQFRAVS